jgi:DNA-binding transcriptional MerR regulator
MEFWKISDFAKEVGKHTNTVDGWFKQLEEKQIHSVSRTEYGEKVYDQLDLDIAHFIKERRDKKWALEAIFNELPNHFELRYIEEMESTNVPQVLDPEFFKKEFEKIARSMVEEQTRELRKQYEDLLKRLPEPKTKEAEREERFLDMVARRKVEDQLEKEALDMWATKPESERKKRVGIFRKEEDRDKRDLFVKEYTNERYEERLRKEFNLS